MRIRFGMAVFVMGFSGLVAQMLLLRELLVVFSGNELSIGIILANWLILEAMGSFFLGKRAENIKNKIETFAGITILFSISLTAAVYLTRILKIILGISIGEGMGFLAVLYSSFFILLPVSVFHGALFTFGCKVYSMFYTQKASSVGRVYVYETVGTIAGGIIWTYLLIPHLHAFQMATGLAMLNLLVCLVLLAPYWKTGRPQKIITSVAGLFLFLTSYFVFAGGADKLHHLSIKAQWKDHNVVHYQNSLYGNICVVKSGGQYTFFSDGIPNIVTPIPDIAFVEAFVHLPLLSHPDPKKLLILSGGAGGVINEILKHPSVERIEYAELDPLVLELLRKFPTTLTEEELNDQRVKVKHIDGRLFLKMTENRYDLILVGLTDPSDLQTNRFFTKEFFSLAKKKLNKDGILVIGLPGSLTYLNDELKNLNGCIFNTIKSVFPYVRINPGDGTNLFFSSKSGEISLIDKTGLVDRLNERNLKTNQLIPWHIEYKLHPRWQDWFLRFLEGSTPRINYDFKPLGMFYSISQWNAIFVPYLRGLFRWIEKINLGLFFLLFTIFVALFFLIRSVNKKIFGTGIPLGLVTTGFAGMISNLALIFTFQSFYGYVFFWLGLLVTFFMAGIAAGAMAVTSVLARIKNDLIFFMKTELLIICFSCGLPLVFLFVHSYLDSPAMFPHLRILFLFIAFVCGFLISAQFPIANKIYLKGDKGLSKTAGLLYGSDLLGGWLGGIAGSVVLLPVLGLSGTFVVIVLLKLSSFIIIAAQSRGTA